MKTGEFLNKIETQKSQAAIALDKNIIILGIIYCKVGVFAWDGTQYKAKEVAPVRKMS